MITLEIGQIWATSYTRIEIVGLDETTVTYETPRGNRETIRRSTFEDVANSQIQSPYKWDLVNGLQESESLTEKERK